MTSLALFSLMSLLGWEEGGAAKTVVDLGGGYLMGVYHITT